jgi:hypothetical protein
MAEIKTILIFEMLGRPPEHLKDTFVKYIEKLSKEEGIEIFDKKINEPKRIEDAKQEIYSTFAEVEADFKDISSLMKIIFVYMPSHIEITSPSSINFKNSELTALMNELTRKMHQYDELAKRLIIEKQILEKKIQEQAKENDKKEDKKKD